MDIKELKPFLDEKANLYNNVSFIETDPIQIPHRFSKKEDIEISAFLTSIIAWGNRKSIINNANIMLEYLDNSPHDFILNYSDGDLSKIEKSAIHRTFNKEDFIFFIKSLNNIYQNHGGLEKVFQARPEEIDTLCLVERFREVFFSTEHLERTKKHISSPAKNSSAKRLNMFLRWMVREDNRGVDFGIWKSIKPSQLVCPLDVHTGNVGRSLGFISRKQNDWKTVLELMKYLRLLDKEDPVKYDYALFGLGIFEKFIK